VHIIDRTTMMRINICKDTLHYPLFAHDSLKLPLKQVDINQLIATSTLLELLSDKHQIVSVDLLRVLSDHIDEHGELDVLRGVH